jgi:FAD/FMN-containing dehydrogenase
MPRVRNFGRNFRFKPKKIAYPSSVEELQSLVVNANELRVMGSRHSWSKGIVTDSTLVSLDKMCSVLEIDAKALRVKAQAGMKLKDLSAKLEAQGLAFANLGSIADQSLAGAMSTGTHGTGIGFRCLAEQVTRLSLVDGRGELRHLSRGDADFNAVVVGLGCFGVVYEMTLSVVPSFQMHCITETISFDDLVHNFDAYVNEHDHFKFWWLVPDDDVILFRQKHTDEPRNDSNLQRWFKDDFLAVVVYRTCLLLERAERKRLVPFINRHLGREIGKYFERICKSYVGFLTPVPPRHRETEWAFDFANAAELLKAYREFFLGTGHTYNFIQEIRVTRGDDFWASPAFGRDSIWLSMYNVDSPARWDDQLRQFEAFARAHGGRPHWGKEADFEPEYLADQLPKLADFATLTRSYDPEGKFVNRWVRGVLPT